MTRLEAALRLPEGASSFPWQRRLLREFNGGRLPVALDIPTGLGKTSVMAVWLVARAEQAPVPRRLVYVVDRRAVVDQASEVAERLRELVDADGDLRRDLGLSGSLPISTLRGQHIDNKLWLEDPSGPAIVVGTVDMIGSRLLFEGYGVSRKMRPYHAAMLGKDTLVVLDEAHLVPAFERLLEAIPSPAFDASTDTERRLVPRMHVLPLSATGRGRGADERVFRLEADDEADPFVRRRLDARKRLTIDRLEDDTRLGKALAAHAWRISAEGTSPVRCVVFCDRRDDASHVAADLESLARGTRADVDIELFVGGRRARERTLAADRLRELGFIAGDDRPRHKASFLVATSAAEVGVDLDADHMISDLVAWERMVQRLGRVNRRGNAEARVIVVVPGVPKDAGSDEWAALETVRARTRALEQLPHVDAAFDASPGAIRALRLRAEQDAELHAVLEAATTVPPLRPALSRATLEAWSMTSLPTHSGRPFVAPWLRGWVDDERQTRVLWRTFLPVVDDRLASKGIVDRYFEAAPPHTSEILEVETYRLVEWLLARAAARPFTTVAAEAAAGVVLSSADEFEGALDLGELDPPREAKSRRRDDLNRRLSGRVVVLDARIGGLTPHGLLDAEVEGAPVTADGAAAWMNDTASVIGFRVRTADAEALAGQRDERWRERFRLVVEETEDGEISRALVVEKYGQDAATEDDRSAGRPQKLDEHQAWTAKRAERLARRLGLPERYASALVAAARLHDEGKKADRWQRAFRAPRDGTYAKTRGPVDIALLDGYRHELGSLRYAKEDATLLAMDPALRDLVLHMIAAHHGFARPLIGVGGCEDAPPSVVTARAQEVALRYTRLQERWGPWGLAWWETLLRAADQQASRDNDARAAGPTEMQS